MLVYAFKNLETHAVFFVLPGLPIVDRQAFVYSWKIRLPHFFTIVKEWGLLGLD